MEEENHQQVKSFKDLGLCDELLEAVKRMNWDAPTRVQAEAIPPALEGKDITVLAETGTGKTAAFGLPILQALLNSSAHPSFFACVLVPLRELAIQIAEQFEALGAGIYLKTAVLVGGIDMLQQQLALAKRPHIIVATPGRLVDHLTNTKGFSLSALKYLVLDEADKLLGDEFEKSIDDILKVIPRERRTYLFSATMTAKVTKIKRACLRNPVKIGTGSKYSTVDTLKQQYLFIPAKYKDCYLVHILMGISGSALVFTQQCEMAHFLALMLRNLGFKALPIHGKMSQSKRLGALNRFKARECNILVCTKVLSRGHDIPSVGTVISYVVPDPKDYIHHVGRTARAGRSGVAISLVSQYEVEAFIRIENLIGKKLPKFSADEDEALLLLERVSEAKRIARMTINTKNYEGGKKRRRKEEMDGEEETYYLDRKTLSKRKNN